MLTWIISTAQHARPKVIHHSEPVRAQLNRSSVEVTRKPLSPTSELRSSKKPASGLVPGATGIWPGGRMIELLFPTPTPLSSRHLQGRGSVRRGTHSPSPNRPRQLLPGCPPRETGGRLRVRG